MARAGKLEEWRSQTWQSAQRQEFSSSMSTTLESSGGAWAGEFHFLPRLGGKANQCETAGNSYAEYSSSQKMRLHNRRNTSRTERWVEEECQARSNFRRDSAPSN